MSVAVSCNLSEGVVLGVDSAVSIPHPQGKGIEKTYENADKLFRLGELPVGIAAFGLSAIGERGIGSYIREFEIKDPQRCVSQYEDLSNVVEKLRIFLLQQYTNIVVPALEAATNKSFSQIPPQNIPEIGLVVGGFSKNAYLSEVWSLQIPTHNAPGSATQSRLKGQFGANWFALYQPIQRYFKGFDPKLMAAVANKIEGLLGRKLSNSEKDEFKAIVVKYEYQVPFAAMPLEEGVCHVRFLVEMVINHYRFSIGAPVVGGQVKIGKVTYRGEKFEITADSN